VVTSTAGAAIIDADGFGKNAGGPTPGLRFGGGGSGEGIASNRVSGNNQFGVDFFTNFTSRMSILNDGQVGIGTTSPTAQLQVVSKSDTAAAIDAEGFTAPSGTNEGGQAAISATGGDGDFGSGNSASGGDGVVGQGGNGTSIDGTGGVFYGGNLFGTSGDGIFAEAGTGNAGTFQGNVVVSGTVSNNATSFRIDHPLDPANKYLSHSAVESPDMLNIYNGNVVTDANGDAVVELPEWFETLNRDFRYQLTVIGQFAQGIISNEVANHQFSIKTDKPGVKVSWLVTGVRQDAWANAHRIPLEEQKNARERGHYLNPELYGAGEEAGIEWARHPATMKRMKDARLKKLTTRPDVNVAR